MSGDHTQKQSPDQQRRARELSLEQARPPAEIPGYRLQRLLGCGAYGEVWVGVEENTGRRVAVKFYTHRSSIDWVLLSREVEKLVFLSADRYVVQLLDVGRHADPPYYVMDYIENGSLEDLLAERGTLSVAESLEIFEEVAVGLIHAHGKGVLHCDLKPANVLLDEDRKPRLADFGQSRLSHEQTPALGTLFYMAPEQADLNALPDARWDVYALGALLYRMLTGELPYRSEAAVAKIEAASGLGDRLLIYRECIRSSPPPTEHRRVAGVDRLLAEIIDRCIAVDPQRRYPNVQMVVDDLRARDAARMRRPLMLLGLVGPVLLLLVMVLFGVRGYEYAMRDSENFVVRRARESNDFAAKFAARSIEGEIERYFALIREEATSEAFLELFESAESLPLVGRLNDPAVSASDREKCRTDFLKDPVRRRLDAYFQQRLKNYLDRLKTDPLGPKFASIFALDAKGRMLAVAYDDPETETKSVGWNYAWRNYFHGGPADLPGYTKESLPPEVSPIATTHFSAPFLSSTTGTWKVAISTPIHNSTESKGAIVGVLAMTLNLGDFAYFRGNYRPDRFAVLLNGRRGPNFGVILQHPLLDQRRREGKPLRAPDAIDRFRVSEEVLERIRNEPRYRYQDPMREAADSPLYDGDWIAAVEDVELSKRNENHQDMIVLVQEKYAEATAPVKQLGRRLVREAAWAVIGFLTVTALVWYFVLRMLQDPHLLRRPPANWTAPPSTHDGATTIATLEGWSEGREELSSKSREPSGPESEP